MKAIGYTTSLPITDENALTDVELAKPAASGRDVLVKINAIAVNPVDFKIRQRVSPENGEPKILGWDAVGEVVEAGNDVETLKVGDRVYYAGDLTRQGTNAEFQLIDERIVGRAPKSLSDSEAAALPLTAITAWELLFQHLALEKQQAGNPKKTNETVLVVGAAGGVGSIMLQLLKTLTGATVIATASRESSIQWVKSLGADYVVNHRQPLAEQITALNIGPVTHVASLNATDAYLDAYVEIMKPMGKIALIDDPEALDISKLKPKSISLHWEFMFTRSMFQTEDMSAQGELLSDVAALIDAGHVKTTVGKHLGKINAANLIEAHKTLEAGTAIGKIVLEGF
ncbi:MULTISPECIES: zinc-binding alcohol dehydrogenase family protein [Alteromonas]|jgi:zinc-binding alcohol dehydrogenase family protein|uniref:Zinc-type alcohol dehydrogenase-like protein n=1 Tax=Alteromonas naphthalenivorans TaxID=715451 RepID=F5ZCH9_ALTNA|nr:MULTISPECIES: zinc-binding alcohol dehydrogenase family protein [Alteromonas]AEF02572.1 zinc-binding oxidoreductase [Alteromonas naphthalenivorans]MBB67586.1 zinc-binding alcohol dehydrogenase family protein [Rickettsiales bacterium]MBO7922795.1 zinc-binding alcohol dehydrogenase family protein [Alteromonas sp. K632G]PHS52728.1 MAG: zinc-binding alcohol dehydrogenase family protein [Alteromonas sp.]|tara:strand:+ start:9902 stop:10927 length:1026 start_codon:yes stop_codon:yes gene_type:complete